MSKNLVNIKKVDSVKFSRAFCEDLTEIKTKSKIGVFPLGSSSTGGTPGSGPG